MPCFSSTKTNGLILVTPLNTPLIFLVNNVQSMSSNAMFLVLLFLLKRRMLMILIVLHLPNLMLLHLTPLQRLLAHLFCHLHLLLLLNILLNLLLLLLMRLLQRFLVLLQRIPHSDLLQPQDVYWTLPAVSCEDTITP